MDLSILIPARNEEYLLQTVNCILENIEGDTEIIIVADGNWPDPPINDHPRVTMIYHSQSIGQRAATNEAAKFSKAKFIMKCDAHCAFDKGFDVKLMETFEYDWTVIPRMYNLHVFNWRCPKCKNETYQGPTPAKCANCDNTEGFEKVIVWQPRRNCRSDFMRFDSDLHFQYWGEFQKRPEAQVDIAPTMSLLGACWMLHRQRYWDLDGMDEAHGSWGQMGTELACKTWLSGGQLLVNKKTWFSHLFRTQPGFGFPYPNPGIATARRRSRELWIGNAWPKAKYPLSWMLRKFAPIPGWTEEQIQALESTAEQVTVPSVPAPEKPVDESHFDEVPADDVSDVCKQQSDDDGPALSGEIPFVPEELATQTTIVMSEVVNHPIVVEDVALPPVRIKPVTIDVASTPVTLTKGCVYYTDNQLEDFIEVAVQRQLDTARKGIELISVSLKPMYFGKNFCVDGERGYLTMFQQILLGLEQSSADIVFLTEHDILYHPSHFDFIPPRDDIYYYNENTWKVDAYDGRAVFYYTKQTSGCCAYRKLLVQHYRARVERVAREGFSRSMGFEPGCHILPRGVDNFVAERYMSEVPNIDIRHKGNLTHTRWRQDQFRSQRSCKGWTLADEVPGWGVTKDRFNSFLRSLANPYPVKS